MKGRVKRGKVVKEERWFEQVECGERNGKR